MILLADLSMTKNSLHRFEFVLPVKKILAGLSLPSEEVHFSELNSRFP